MRNYRPGRARRQPTRSRIAAYLATEPVAPPQAQPSAYIATAYNISPRARGGWTVICPFCGRKHHHGGKLGTWRIADCGMGTYLLFDGEASR